MRPFLDKDLRCVATLQRWLSLGTALVFSSLVWGCASSGPNPTPSAAVSRTPATATQLTVGLYPFVPRPEQFEQVIKDAWKTAEPGVTLNFLSASAWDGGYSMDPPASADVFVFDAMFLEYFRSKNWLEKLQPDEIQNIDDFLPYAIAGVKAAGQYYAIPQLGCANMLFYQQDDTALAKAATLSQLKAALSQCTYTSQIPPDRRGLMIDMSGGTTNASLYLDAEHSLTGQYPFPLPPTVSDLDAKALSTMRQLLSMASFLNGTTSTGDPYQRSEWFSDGWGRAVVGYTESMSEMSPQTLQTIAFRPLPLSDNANPPVFYADVIAVNTSTASRGTRPLAVKLANLLAAKGTMAASIGPDGANPRPQYLMPVRPSVFQALAPDFPAYEMMYQVATASNPIMFKLDASARTWLDSMKSNIRTAARQGFPCGCDRPAAATIFDDAGAPAICNPTCADFGGWDQQWTNLYPAAPSGSVCGCNTCPVSQ